MFFEGIGVAVYDRDHLCIRRSHFLDEAFGYYDAGDSVALFNEADDLFLGVYLLDVDRVLDAVHLLDEADSEPAVSFVVRHIACDCGDAVRAVLEKKLRRIHYEREHGDAEC